MKIQFVMIFVMITAVWAISTLTITSVAQAQVLPSDKVRRTYPETEVRLKEQRFGYAAEPGANPEKTRELVRNYMKNQPEQSEIRPENGLKNLTGSSAYSLAGTLKRSPLAFAEAEKIPGVGKIVVTDGFVKLTETQAVILGKRLESFLTKNQKASPFVTAVIQASDYTVASHTLRSAKAAINNIGRSRLIKIMGTAALATAAARASAEENKGSEDLRGLGSVEASTAPSFKLPSRAAARSTSN